MIAFCKSCSLLLLSPSISDLHLSLDRCTASCGSAGKNISIKKIEILHLTALLDKSTNFQENFEAGGEVLVSKVTFSSDGRLNKKLNIRIGKANVMTFNVLL